MERALASILFGGLRWFIECTPELPRVFHAIQFLLGESSITEFGYSETSAR
jgi:hypothetical protein